MDIATRFRLDGKTALVTGAGRGIGRAIALALAAAGADVAIASRTRGDLDSLALEIQRHGRRALVLAGDVGKTADLASTMPVARVPTIRCALPPNSF
jgi:7-alpha-hydroxysteroid dehydrogenase